MNIKNCLTVVALAGLAAGCSDSVGLQEQDRVLLEIEYINYAFNPTYFGWFIDASGRVFRYDQDLPTAPNTSIAEWTPEELSEKFGIYFEVAQRPLAEINGLDAQISAAAAGSLSPAKMECADAGTLTYRAFTYDRQDEVYRSVLLRVEGDVARQNTSQAAQQLIAYIRSLQLLPELEDCDP
jgi:hypothetical protein